MNRTVEYKRGNAVATAVWGWLKNQRQIKYVPWVLDPDSDSYEPIKAARQSEREEILQSLTDCIQDVVERLNSEEV